MNLILLINLALNKSEMINNIPKIKNTGSGNFFVMAGPCAIEGEEMAFKIAEKISDITSRLEIPFIFKGSLSSMYKQIGNAVPVLLAQKISEGIRLGLDKYESKENKSIQKVKPIQKKELVNSK